MNAHAASVNVTPSVSGRRVSDIQALSANVTTTTVLSSRAKCVAVSSVCVEPCI